MLYRINGRARWGVVPSVGRFVPKRADHSKRGTCLLLLVAHNFVRNFLDNFPFSWGVRWQNMTKMMKFE